MTSEAPLTQLLQSAVAGDDDAREQVYSLTYSELERLARIQLSKGAHRALGTGSLVHEAYMKMFGGAEIEVRDRSHFWALSSRVMRQVLVDFFRRSVADRRGGGERAATLEEGLVPSAEAGDTVLAVHEALKGLEEIHPRLARVVECKFFGGMSYPEIAEALDTSERTARRDWGAAKTWLAHHMREGTDQAKAH